MSATIAIILDTRRIKENKKYPIKLRVNYNRVTNYYQTVFDLSEEEYQRLSAPRISSELQGVKNQLKKIEREAEDKLKELHPFSFSEFEKVFAVANPLFKQRKRKINPIEIQTKDGYDYTAFYKKFPILEEKNIQAETLTYSYQQYIKKLLRQGRISTAVNYHCSYVSLNKFRGNVLLTEVTAEFLSAYEQKVKGEGLSKSTIGIYLRPLRAILNEAIEEGLLKKDKSYPFGRRKYQIPTSRNIKKALELSEVEQIYYYPSSKLTQTEERCRDFWLFSYFGSGMNPKDIATLKYHNIQEDYIIFERAKTEHSLRSDPKPIVVYLNEDMKRVIQKWGNIKSGPNDYVFPILVQGITPLRQYTLIQNFVSLVNDCMKKILKDLGINKKATTYVARHTFSTVLKRSGASTEAIQEALGHTDIKTTENYLDSFDKDTKRQLANLLSSFKRKEPEVPV